MQPLVSRIMKDSAMMDVIFYLQAQLNKRKYITDNSLLRSCVNPLNATGANMHQVLMVTENYGNERVKLISTFPY